MESTCILIDSQNQTITHDKQKSANIVDHGKWQIELPQEIIQTLTTPVVSPFTVLFHYYLQTKEQTTLYIAILENYLYFAIFNEEEIVYHEIQEASQELQNAIEQFLHRFYSQPNSFFVEKVKIFPFIQVDIDTEKLQDALLLDVEIASVDADEICQIKAYLFMPPKSEEEPEEKPPTKKMSNWNLYFALVSLLLFVAVATYDWYLKSSIKEYEQKVDRVLKEERVLGNKNNELKSKLMLLDLIAPEIKRITEHNKMVTGRIKAIFDLVGPHTYLTRAEFGKGTLLLEGVTTKAIEVKRMHSRLRASFLEGRLELKKVAKGYRFSAVYKGGVYAE